MCWCVAKSSLASVIGGCAAATLKDPAGVQLWVDSSIRHQRKRGWFIYLVNTCASLITAHITLKEFHLHQSRDCSIQKDFFPSRSLLSSSQDGIKSWLSFNSFNVASFPAAVSG